MSSRAYNDIWFTTPNAAKRGKDTKVKSIISVVGVFGVAFVVAGCDGSTPKVFVAAPVATVATGTTTTPSPTPAPVTNNTTNTTTSTNTTTTTVVVTGQPLVTISGDGAPAVTVNSSPGSSLAITEKIVFSAPGRSGIKGEDLLIGVIQINGSGVLNSDALLGLEVYKAGQLVAVGTKVSSQPSWLFSNVDLADGDELSFVLLVDPAKAFAYGQGSFQFLLNLEDGYDSSTQWVNVTDGRFNSTGGSLRLSDSQGSVSPRLIAADSMGSKYLAFGQVDFDLPLGYEVVLLAGSTTLNNGTNTVISVQFRNLSSEGIVLNFEPFQLQFLGVVTLSNPQLTITTSGGSATGPASYSYFGSSAGNADFSQVINLAPAGQLDDSVVLTLQVDVAGASSGDSLLGILPNWSPQGYYGSGLSLPFRGYDVQGVPLVY